MFPLGTERLSSEQLGLVQNLAAVGANLSFVWETGLEPVLMELPPAFRWTALIPVWGNSVSLGFGFQCPGALLALHKDAQGLFP